MSVYSLETGEYIYRLTCECCGTAKNRVWGFVSDRDNAHAVYYALLNVAEENPRLGLTLSVGPWWEGTEPSQRSWVHIDIRAEANKIQLAIRDAEESNFYPWVKGGKPLSPEQVAANSAFEEFRAVANFIIKSDVAISSYLGEIEVNAAGRELRDADQPLHHC